jgi:hypothetical protein
VNVKNKIKWEVMKKDERKEASGADCLRDCASPRWCDTE